MSSNKVFFNFKTSNYTAVTTVYVHFKPDKLLNAKFLYTKIF